MILRRRALVAVAPAVLAALLVAGCRGDANRAAAPAGAELAGLGASTAGWRTDFSRRSVPLEEFHSGGPPRDGIPPIDEARFVPQARVDLPAREPVIVVEIRGQAQVGEARPRTLELQGA